jgi:hypothetical protein
MNEFFREVDEEYRRDQLTRIWTRYNGLIVAVVVLIVAGVGGWRYWQHVERTKAEAASIRFDDAVRLAREGKSDEAEQALATLGSEAPGGYRTLARLRLASEKAKDDTQAGATLFDEVASDAAVDPLFQDLARLRAAMLRMDEGDPQTWRPTLERLAVPANAWRHTARETLGLAALKSGDYDAAGRWFDQIAADRDTPQGLRSRLEVWTSIVAAGPLPKTN